ncbi:hypothetical protein G7Y89_g7562 [Cudoniella acicularis]|uniref:Zn(2)-C6 fungal-type domain-containing protein n=1 Tax=Cudoniella acicularis TaxID=354080 RepID=A0A8H4RK86_9HELO|nr:hypothetical protein G7Y89_g7562 [Cudoniella acicularis]
MAPGMGIKAPVPRTRTGCLTCRKRKVKCDEGKPICGRCHRLQRECVWSDELQIIPQRRYNEEPSSTIMIANGCRNPALQLSKPSGQNFVIEFPNIDRTTIPYIHHFVTFCCRFLAYPNDSEGNPFQEELVPLATSSPALMHSMTALAAAHLSRSQRQHEITAAHHYSLALRELNSSLSDPALARSDSTLGACLLLCVYEISHSDSCLWLEHLQGARDLILFRGGPRTSDYLTRFFSLLDVSGSLSSGAGPLIQGNYWIENGLDGNGAKDSKLLRWPYYDDGNVMVNHFHELMIYMAKLSRLSSEAMSDLGRARPDLIVEKAARISDDLRIWWSNCPPALRDQSRDWRRLPRVRKLTVPETLEEEAFSSTKSCLCGCIIYLNHILDPLGLKPQRREVTDAVSEILEIANETPEGYGLEMGLYWGLFMAGVAIFNDVVAENLIRRKLKSDTSVSIYNYSKFFGNDNINMGQNMTGGRSKSKWEFKSTGQKTILLLGGTGKVASRIIPLLSTANYNVLVASRSGSSPSLPHCTGVKFDWFDPSTYGTLFTGSPVSAVYLISPPVIDSFPLMKEFIDLAKEKGVKRFVLQSASVLDVGDGPIMGKVSGYIAGLGVEFAILRPTWFMGMFTFPSSFQSSQRSVWTIQSKFVFGDHPSLKWAFNHLTVVVNNHYLTVTPSNNLESTNLSNQSSHTARKKNTINNLPLLENFSEQQHLPTIRLNSQIISATDTGKIPFISVHDIALVAFHALTDLISPSTDLLLLGPELFSYDEVAAMLTEKLGRKITHVKITEEQLAESMREFGIPKDYVRMLAQLDTWIKGGGEEGVNDVVAKVTGREPKFISAVSLKSLHDVRD